MAPAAATAVASSFSASMQTLASSKTWPCYYDHARVSCSRMASLQPSATASPSLITGSGMDQLSPIISAAAVSKWKTISRMAAAVAQEEASMPAPVEEKPETEGDESSEAPNSKLYFGNLPYNCDSAELAALIQDYASPELVEVLYDRDTGKSRGFAFATMSSVEECNTVIENLDGREYGGRSLRVNFSDKPKPKAPLYPETEHKLFVGNLAWSVTSETLEQVFQEYGNMVGARVLYDGETGRSRGYGFVCYETRQEMEAALQALNGMELEGRAIRISLAQGKKQ